jgi:AraC-like DNA-binding protein
MSDNAVMDKKLSDDLQKAVDDTLMVELQACASLVRNQPRYGNWVTFNASTFSLMVRGEAVTEFKPEKIVKRTEGILCYFPSGSWRRTVILDPVGADIRWCRCFYTVFNGFDLLSLYDTPTLFSRESSLFFMDIHKKLLKLDELENVSPFEIAAGRKELCYSLLNLILSQSQLKPEAFKRIHQLQRFGVVIKYLKKHFRESVSVDTLAELAYLSKSQFHRQFKAAFSVAPFEYLKKLRIQNAVKLLQHSDLSIYEVGEQCGWKDQFHFSRIFKAAIGLSPGKYRERLRADFEAFLAGF